jgi:uncharacterized repeat protein (TIGR01451 family)
VTTRRTGRWWFATVAALTAGGVGALTTRATPFALAALAVVYATYARVVDPAPGALALEREVSASDPDPGERVEVTVTLANEGGRPLADVRVVDGVPDALEVVEGTPRHGTALRAGATTTYSYTVVAVRGQHGFDPATVVVRDPSGAGEVETTAENEMILTVVPPLSTVPPTEETLPYTGDVTTDEGGSGLSVHSVRDHRPGDPMNRVDWNRLARTGDLATVRFREERAARVVLVVDARPEAFWSRAPDERHAVEASVSAAGQVFSALLSAGDRVGITNLGPEQCWLPPRAGRDHAVRARRLLATHDAFAYAPPDSDRERRELAIEPEHEPVDVDALRARIPADTGLVLFSPLCDDAVVDAVRRLAEYGYDVTVVAPDPTVDGERGERHARLQRRNRVRELGRAGVTVFDWGPEESLADALATGGRASR